MALLADIEKKIELGGTHNPAAFDAYLRAAKASQLRHDAEDLPIAIAGYSESIRLDPNFALAFAFRSIAHAAYAGEGAASGAAVREGFEKAEADARQALVLAPELAEAHAALAFVFESGRLDFAPGSARVLHASGSFASDMGHFEAALAELRHGWC